MILLGLASRLAVAGGRLRAVLVVIGCAVGTLVLLVAVAVPSTQPQPLSRDDRHLFEVVLLSLAIPVVALIASVTRVSAGVRDRRLAALRSLGVSSTATRAVAGIEATLHAAVGAAAGALLFLAVRPGVVVWDDGRWFHGKTLQPGVIGWLLTTTAVVGVCFVVAILPSRQVTNDPLATVRQATAARPRPWRVVPLIVGLALLAWPVLRHTPGRGQGAHGDAVTAFLIGAAVTALGLPLAAPILVRLAGDLLVRFGRPGVTLAGRRLQQEPAGGVRLIATLLAAVFFVVGARCVVTAFEQTPQAQDGRRVAVTGPQYVDLGDTQGTPTATTALRGIEGVRTVTPYATGDVACGRVPRRGALDPDTCGSFIVANCARLSALGTAVAGCRDGRLQWVLPRGTDLPANADTLLTTNDSADAGHTVIAGRVALQPGLPVLHRSDDTGTMSPLLALPLVVVPPEWPGLRSLGASAPGLHLRVSADGGAEERRRVIAAAQSLGLHVDSVEYDGDWTAVAGYRGLVTAIGATLFSLALLALLVTGIDAAIGRRRQLASLARIGVPTRMAGTAQAWQTAVPAAFGGLLAAGTGLLAGTGYLAIAGIQAATPWPDALLFATSVVIGALLAAVICAAAVGRTRPQDLQRE